MLNSEKAVFAMNDVDDNHLESARVMLGYETGKRAGNTFKKRIITFALAAALILALGTVAYAIGMSIHRLRQEELRKQLQIEENQVADYVEYPVVEEPEKSSVEGVTLLSTMERHRASFTVIPSMQLCTKVFTAKPRVSMDWKRQ